MTIQEQAYIGGPMRNRPRFGFDQFDSLAHWLRRNRKWNVHNPAEHDRETWPEIETWEGFATGDTTLCPQFDLGKALSWDLARVAESQHLVLLPGWEKSTGAQHERHVAELTGSSIWLAEKDGGIGPSWLLKLDMSREGSLQPTPTPVVTFTDEDGPYIGSFVTKDSGQRASFASGMVRDTDEGKPRYDLIPLMPLRRLAELYARGAQKYAARNWEQANSTDELERFKGSALRHLYQALEDDRTEDHLSGVVFNVFAWEWLEQRLAYSPDGGNWPMTGETRG